MSLQRGAQRISCRAPGGVSVILRQALDQLGYVGQEVVVRPGFARNYLIPKEIAVYATEANRARHKVALEGDAYRTAELERAQRLMQARVAALVVVFQRATKESGELYSPVKASDISTQLESTPLRTLGVKEGNVRIPSPIERAGEYTVEVEAVKQQPGLWCPLKLRVVVSA